MSEFMIALKVSYGGLPLWGWLVMVLIGVVNEAIQRSKWTEAQTIWQAFWRILLGTPIGKIPLVTIAIQYMADRKLSVVAIALPSAPPADATPPADAPPEVKP